MHKYSLFMCKIPSISDIFKVNHSCDTEINLSKYCLQPSASTEGCAAYRCICTPVLVYVWQLQDKLHCLIFRCPIKEFKRNSTQILKGIQLSVTLKSSGNPWLLSPSGFFFFVFLFYRLKIAQNKKNLSSKPLSKE